jgi:plastocyanin
VLLATGPLRGRAAQPAANPSAGQAHTVIIEDMRFNPRTLTVRRGDRVTWINKDPFPHTVTATDGKFDSHAIAPDGSWTYAARKAGEYDYVCTLHVTMKGRLLVR